MKARGASDPVWHDVYVAPSKIPGAGEVTRLVRNTEQCSLQQMVAGPFRRQELQQGPGAWVLHRRDLHYCRCVLAVI